MRNYHSGNRDTILRKNAENTTDGTFMQRGCFNENRNKVKRFTSNQKAALDICRAHRKRRLRKFVKQDILMIRGTQESRKLPNQQICINA